MAFSLSLRRSVLWCRQMRCAPSTLPLSIVRLLPTYVSACQIDVDTLHYPEYLCLYPYFMCCMNRTTNVFLNTSFELVKLCGHSVVPLCYTPNSMHTVVCNKSTVHRQYTVSSVLLSKHACTVFSENIAPHRSKMQVLSTLSCALTHKD